MQKRNITVIFLITLIGVMGVASISPILPTVREHYDLTKTEAALLVTFFTLPGIFLAPVVGLLADRYGRKNIIVPSLILFGIAGVGCFFTQSWNALLTLRFIQGIGGASLGMLNITLIGDLFDGAKRGEIMGYNASVLSIGTASYPAVGGALGSIGWQYPFLLPFLAIPTALMVLFWLKNPEPAKKPDLKEYFLKTWKIINQKTVWGLLILNIFMFVILYGAYISYFPQMMEERFKTSSLYIGMVMSGFSVVTAITSSQLKKINQLIKPKQQLQIGFGLYLVSMLLLSFANEYWQLIFPIITFGMAHGVIIPGIQTLLVGFAPLSERAGFMSVNGMVLRIGQTIGPLFIGLFFMFGGTEMAFIGGALVAVVMIVISFAMLKF